MAAPAFDPDTRKLLFFCRGRGRGHAIPDIEIVRELGNLREDVDVRFVSYGTGAKTLADNGLTVIDIGLPEINSFLDVIVLSTKLIGWLQPEVVVSHEEFGALPAAKAFDLPTLFITDWYVDENRIIMSALRFADEILFIDDRPKAPEPCQARGKTTYLGPFVRRFEYARTDRARARQELGLPTDSAVICVLPSGHATEREAPIAELVLTAFDHLDIGTKRLLWIAGDSDDFAALVKRTAGRNDIIVKEYERRIDRVMVASDAAITKGTRKTAAELESLGIPCVALSPGSNPIDDRRAGNRPGVTLRRIDEVGADGLARDLDAAIRSSAPRPTSPAIPAAEAVARRIGSVFDENTSVAERRR